MAMNSSELKVDAEAGEAGESYSALADWRGCEQGKQGLLCRAANGALRLEFAGEGILRVTASMGSMEPGRRGRSELSGVADGRRADPPEAMVAEDAGLVLLSSGGMEAALAKGDFSLAFSYQGKALTRAGAPRWAGPAIRLDLGLGPGDSVYGLGEKTGFLDKRGGRYSMWNSDVFHAHNASVDPLYASIPFYLALGSGRAYGLFFDNPRRSSFDIGAADWELCSITAPDGPIDYYVIAGPGLPEVLSRYSSLTGRMPIPPKWAIGNHQSRFGLMTGEEVEAIAREFRRRDLPLDAIYLDIDYMDGARTFTWNGDRFPDPAAMTGRLKAMGVRTVAIVDPGIKAEEGYPVYDEMVAGNLACKAADGSDYQGPVWPGPCVFPDFLKERTRYWWGRRELAFMRRYGIDGIWHDMNEPSVFNADSTMDEAARHGERGDTSHAECHNAYASLENRAGYEAIRAGTKKRPFILSRAGFSGVQRHAALWTGDNRSMWEHLELSLPMILNMGLSGLPFVGADIGGFACDSGGELLARWYQLGAFYPLCRNHCEKRARRQEPWSFGRKVESIVRDALRLRYALMPELYTAFYAASVEGRPVMRPLAFDFPDDPAARSICDQFLFGDGLMVAPVLRPGVDHRMVYLPAGDWVDLADGSRHSGQKWIVSEAPLERIPLFLKAGRSMTTQLPGRNAYDSPSDLLTIAIAADPLASPHLFQLYDDDGEGFGHEEGGYRLDRFSAGYEGGVFRIARASEVSGYESRFRRIKFALSGLGPFAEIRVDGLEVAPLARGEGRADIELASSFSEISVL
jgi:alpha-glucosidase